MASKLNYVFVDGADGIGKTTLVANLCNKDFNANPYATSDIIKVHRIQLPSSEGALGFLRGVVRDKDFICDDFSRQLIHSCDNIHSYTSYAYESYINNLSVQCNQKEFAIFDRGTLSTLVYGDVLFRKRYSDLIASEYVDLLGKINLEVLDNLVDKLFIDKIYYINLFKNEPYRSEKDDSYYENETSFWELNEKYKDMAQALYIRYDSLMLERIKIVNLDLDKLAEKEISQSSDIAEYIWNSILLKN